MVIERKPDLPSAPEAIEPQIIPTRDETEAENDEGRGKRIRKEGRRMWSDEPTNPLVPPGIQLMAEGEANDEDLTDWLYVVPAHVEGYVFAAVTGDSEALEPRSLAEAKRGGDWPL